MTSWHIAFIDLSSRYEQLFISVYKRYTPWTTKISNRECQSGLQRLTLLGTTLGQIATTNHILERLQSWQLQDEEEDVVVERDVEEAAGEVITDSPCPLLPTTAPSRESLEEAGDVVQPSPERQNTLNEPTVSGGD
jgi:hypothetical protein